MGALNVSRGGIPLWKLNLIAEFPKCSRCVCPGAGLPFPVDPLQGSSLWTWGEWVCVSGSAQHGPDPFCVLSEPTD